MENQTVLYEQSGNIVTITYNRPNKQNAINGQMRKELNDAWDKFSEDETAVVILTGAGLLSVAELTYDLSGRRVTLKELSGKTHHQEV